MKPFNLENPITDIKVNSGESFLHGDVVLVKVDSLPADFSSMDANYDGVLAHGEATFHMHKLFRMPDKEGAELPCFELKTSKDGIKFLKVNEPALLRHQEHREITVPPGQYKIDVQREYDPFTKRARQVAD